MLIKGGKSSEESSKEIIGVMYQQYIWMDIVCRDDEKKEPGRLVPFFVTSKTL